MTSGGEQGRLAQREHELDGRRGSKQAHRAGCVVVTVTDEPNTKEIHSMRGSTGTKRSYVRTAANPVRTHTVAQGPGWGRGTSGRTSVPSRRSLLVCDVGRQQYLCQGAGGSVPARSQPVPASGALFPSGLQEDVYLPQGSPVLSYRHLPIGESGERACYLE